MAQVKVIISGGFSNAYRQVLPEFEESTGIKVTTGSAEDWPALGVAVALDTEGATVRAARVVVSAATEKAIRLDRAEQALAGAAIDDRSLARAGDAAADQAECISDVRGSAAYKRELVRVCVARAARQALDSGAPHR